MFESNEFDDHLNHDVNNKMSHKGSLFTFCKHGGLVTSFKENVTFQTGKINPI